MLPDPLGRAGQMLISAVMGAAWGATIGAILAAGAYAALGSPPEVQPGQPTQQPYLQLGSIVNKYYYGAQSTATDVAGVSSNLLGLGNDTAQLVADPSWGNAGLMLPDFIGTTYGSNLDASFDNGAMVNIPLGWVPEVVLNKGGFASLVNASFVADQAGFSYADQISMLFKATPPPFLHM